MLKLSRANSKHKIEYSQSKLKPSRSTKNAYIVLIGLTGAGKSSTIDFLFDGASLREQNSYTSSTSRIIEYAITVPNLEDGRDDQLILVDTPGFGDTRGKPFERDAQFLATLESFIMQHPHLQRCFPNVVILAIKYDDDKIIRETSTFIQMLKGLEAVVSQGFLVDRNRASCNFLVVLTHTMSEATEVKRIDPSDKIKVVEGLIKTFTSIPTPIPCVVMAENKPQQYNLPEQNGYYQLPNGDYYPYNLFTSIQILTERSRDEIGETLLRAAFRSPQLLRKRVASNMQLLNLENPLVHQYLHHLRNARFSIANSPMNDLLDEIWSALPSLVATPHENSLPLVKKIFQDYRINSRHDLPEGVGQVRDLVAELPMNEGVRLVLDKLQIFPPLLPLHDVGVGWFYNIFSDSLSDNCPFKMKEYKVSSMGFSTPVCIYGRQLSDVENIIDGYPTRLEYNKKRIEQLNLSQVLHPELFQGIIKNGHNILKSSETVDEITGWKEYRKYKISLSDNVLLKSDYALALGNLRSRTKKGKKEQLEWNAYFATTGTHFVRSAYAGGAIEIRAVRDVSKDKHVTAVNMMILLSNILENLEAPMVHNLEESAPDWKFIFRFHGGDSNIVCPTTNQMFTEVGRKTLKMWEQSLTLQPILLPSEIKLESIVYPIQRVDPALADWIEGVIKALYQTGTRMAETGGGPIPRYAIPLKIKRSRDMCVIS